MKPPPGAGRDALLQSSRRVDWRFLLPSPELPEVACAAAELPPDLAAGLRRHAGRVVEIDLETAACRPARFDCVVLRNPTPRSIEAAAAVAGARGCIYAELEGATLKALLTRVRARRALARAGFSRAELHWHWPSFAECAEIVPLGDPAPLRLSLRRRRSSWGARLRAAAARAVPRQALALIAPCLSVVAVRPDDPPPGPAVLRHLERSFERLRLARYGVQAPLSGLFVTPRFRASQHVVVLVADRASPEPRLVVKVPRLRGGASGVEREAANLAALHEAWPNAAGRAPRVVALEEIGGRLALVETALRGEPMTPALVRRHPRRCLEAGLALLAELPGRPADERWLERLVEQPLRRLAERLPKGAEQDLIERTLAVVEPLRRAPLELPFEHGDVSAPNLFFVDRRRAGLVDWELAEPRGLPLGDAVFFLTFAALAQAAARTPEAQRAAFARAFIEEGAWAPAALRAHAARRGVPGELIAPLFVACFARYVARLLDRLCGDPAEAVRPAAIDDADATHGWLCENRYYRIWRDACEASSRLRW